VLYLKSAHFIYTVSEEMQEMNSSGGRLRRSAVGNIERARSKTLKMTLVIGNIILRIYVKQLLILVISKINVNY
jgi:hypothetical protein